MLIAGGTRTRLNGTLGSGGDVLDHAISPDSTRVVYLADQNVDALNELWSVPVGGGTATRLNRTLTSGGDVQAFRISPDSNFVVYGADQDTDTVDELLSVSLTGGSVVNLNDPLVPGGDVSLKIGQTPLFLISSISLDVLYAADGLVDDEIEFFAFSQVGAPSAPTAVVASPGNSQATVTFLPPANDGGSNITGYIVTPSPATGGWSDVNAGSTNLTHLITGLTNGTSYTFTVRATNANGTGIPSLPSQRRHAGDGAGSADRRRRRCRRHRGDGDFRRAARQRRQRDHGLHRNFESRGWSRQQLRFAGALAPRDRSDEWDRLHLHRRRVERRRSRRSFVAVGERHARAGRLRVDRHHPLPAQRHVQHQRDLAGLPGPYGLGSGDGALRRVPATSGSSTPRATSSSSRSSTPARAPATTGCSGGPCRT